MINLFVQETTLIEVIHAILTFIYFLAHQIGIGIMKVMQSIFTNRVFPNSIIDPLGVLIILTLFLLIISISKRIAWIIVGAAWILLFIRILLIIFKIG